MKIQKQSLFAFRARPDNYAKIDKHVSRSAQPNKEDFAWLKEQGITDVINFRTMIVENIDFNEENEVINLGMKYHNIPSITRSPKPENINKFLNLIEEIKNRNGKAHIHCKAGADRTGMYAFIYKMLKGIGTLASNEKEWLEHGHNTQLYPDLRNWVKNFLKIYSFSTIVFIQNA